MENEHTPPTRRDVMTRALAGAAVVAGAGALLAGCGSGSGSAPAQSLNLPNTGATPTPNPTPNPSATPLDPTRLTDPDILNFALNLEYLEAEYYLRAIGQSLTAAETTGGNGAAGGSVTGGRAVNFTTQGGQQYANEIAFDERNHVNFLRTALGSAAVARPQINFTDAFNALANAAGFGSFDPFADEASFLLGAFVFEDVGVTAYKGAAKFIKSKGIVEPASGILAVEAIHAAVIRTLLFDLGGTSVTRANQITALRAAAGGGKDEPLTVNGTPNFVVAQNNINVYSRTFAEVLRIVYLTPTGTPASGGFFPQGTNGTITQAV